MRSCTLHKRNKPRCVWKLRKPGFMEHPIVLKGKKHNFYSFTPCIILKPIYFYRFCIKLTDNNLSYCTKMIDKTSFGKFFILNFKQHHFTELFCHPAMNTKNGYCLTEEEADPAKLNVTIWLIKEMIFVFSVTFWYFGVVYLHSVEVLQEQ